MTSKPLHLIEMHARLPEAGVVRMGGQMVYGVPVYEITAPGKASLRLRVMTGLAHKAKAKALARLIEKAPLLLAFAIDMRTELTAARKAAAEAGDTETAGKIDGLLDVLQPLTDYIVAGEPMPDDEPEPSSGA